MSSISTGSHQRTGTVIDCSGSKLVTTRLAAALIAAITPPTAYERSVGLDLQSLPYYESCCLHLLDRIKCNDPYFCIGILPLTSLGLTNNIARIETPTLQRFCSSFRIRDMTTAFGFFTLS